MSRMTISRLRAVPPLNTTRIKLQNIKKKVSIDNHMVKTQSNNYKINMLYEFIVADIKKLVQFDKSKICHLCVGRALIIIGTKFGLSIYHNLNCSDVCYNIQNVADCLYLGFVSTDNLLIYATQMKIRFIEFKLKDQSMNIETLYVDTYILTNIISSESSNYIILQLNDTNNTIYKLYDIKNLDNTIDIDINYIAVDRKYLFYFKKNKVHIDYIHNKKIKSFKKIDIHGQFLNTISFKNYNIVWHSMKTIYCLNYITDNISTIHLKNDIQHIAVSNNVIVVISENILQYYVKFQIRSKNSWKKNNNITLNVGDINNIYIDSSGKNILLQHTNQIVKYFQIV